MNQRDIISYIHFLLEVSHTINPLTPGTNFAKNAFSDILVVLRLDFCKMSLNLLENAFATQQLALLAPGNVF